MIDVAKAANALSRPGIDPRKFVDLGIITAVDVTAAGVHVDLTTIDGVQETAAVAPPYGGPGYGLHLPIDLDRTALLAVPDGKFNLGARVIGTVWDAGDPPPQEALENPDDVVLVVKPGQSLHLVVKGGGNILIDSQDSGNVTIGNTKSAGGFFPPLTRIDGAQLIEALTTAIATQAGNPQGAAALTAFKNALNAISWPTGASSVVVK